MISRINSLFANWGKAKQGHFLLCCSLFLLSALCNFFPKAPSRIVPTTNPKLNIAIIEIPESLCIGDRATIKIKTSPGNECMGVISFHDSENSWSSINLETEIADENGICEWIWYSRADIAPGTGELRIVVEGYGDQSSLIPQSFELVKCE